MRLLIRQPQLADRCDWSKLDGGDWACLLRWHPDICGECGFSLLSASDWCNVLAVRPDLVGAFEASTHDWAADEKVVSGEEVEMMIPAEEFFKDAE